MKKIVLLALALILAVGGLGVGFAHWSGTLDISGSVQMMNMRVGFYDWSGGDPGTDYILNPKPPPTGYQPPGGQNIGSATLTPSNLVCNSPVVEGGDPINHYKTLTVTLTNVYPGYFVDWELHIHNCGTVPVRILPAVVSPPQTALSVTCPDGVLPAKLHPCESIVYSLIIYCLQPTTQTSEDGVQPGHAPYTFTVTIPYEQWQ